MMHDRSSRVFASSKKYEAGEAGFRAMAKNGNRRWSSPPSFNYRGEHPMASSQKLHSNFSSRSNVAKTANANSPATSPRPSSSLSSAVTTAINVPGPILDNGLHKYMFEVGECEQLSQDYDLGFPDVFERKLGRDEEDCMSEYNVRNGFVDKPLLQNELYSAHELIHDRLSNTGMIYGLEQFMVNVLKRRHDGTRISGPTTFKTYNRVTLTDQKRDAWMQDLAGAQSRASETTQMQTLHKLVRTMPHGLCREKLLDAVALRRVPTHRACWFIRSVGFSEWQQNSRLKQNYTQAQYNLEWSSSVISWIRKSISSAANFSSSSSFQSKKAAPAKVTTSKVEDSIGKAYEQLKYAFRLVRHLYIEGLLDHRSWLKSCVEAVSKAEGNTVGFNLTLIEDYLADILRSRALVRMLLETISGRLAEIEQSGRGLDEYTRKRLCTLFVATFFHCSDAFVKPSQWPSLEKDLYVAWEYLLKHVDKSQLSFVSSIQLDDIERRFQVQIKNVRQRNQAFLQISSIQGMASSKNKMDRSHLLDGISLLTDYSSLSKELFAKDPHDGVISIATCATTHTRSGEWRIYAALSLIKQYATSMHTKAIVQSALLSFLDGAEVDEYSSITRFFGELIASRVFSYSKYLQRLVSRGDLQPSRRSEDNTQKHLFFLQMFPLDGSCKSQVNQRRVIVSESSIVDEGVIENNINLVKEGLKSMLPGMFGGESTSQPTNDFNASLTELMSTSLHRNGQLKVSHDWLLPLVKNFIVKDVSIGEDNWRVMTMPGSSLLNITQFCVVLRAFELLHDYRSLIDLCLWMLNRTVDKGLLECAILSIDRHILTFCSMMERIRILETIYAKHKQLKQKGTSIRSIMRLLLELTDDVAMRSEIATDLKTTPPVGANQLSSPPSAYLEEIHALKGSSIAMTPSSLASTLWFRYASFSNWMIVVLDNCVACCIEIAAAASADANDLRQNLLPFIQLMQDLGERDPDTLLSSWTAWAQIKIFGPRCALDQGIYMKPESIGLTLLLVGICERGNIRISDVSRGLILPLVQAASEVVGSGNVTEMVSKTVMGMMALLRSMLICEPIAPIHELIELTLEQNLNLNTHRTKLGSACSEIASIIHYLHVIHSAVPFNDPLSNTIHHFEQELANTSWFREAVIQQMQEVYQKLTSGNPASTRKGLDFLTTTLEAQSSLHMSSATIADQFRDLVSRASKWNIKQMQISFRLALDRALLQDEEIDDGMPNSQQNSEEVLASVVEQFFSGLVFDEKIDVLELCDLVTEMKESRALMFHHYGRSLLFDDSSDGFIHNLTIKSSSISRERFMSHWKRYISVMSALNCKDSTIANSAFTHISSFEEELETLKKMQGSKTFAEAKEKVAEDDWENLTLDEIRICLEVRLCLAGMSLLRSIQEQQQGNGGVEGWVMTLIRLLVNPLVHKNGLSDDLFTVVLDLVSVLIDDVDKSARQSIMNFLRTVQLDDVPINFRARFNCILPFEVRNIYTEGLCVRGATTVTGQSIPFRPWDWMEDGGKAGSECSVNDAPISLGVFGAKRMKYKQELE